MKYSCAFCPCPLLKTVCFVASWEKEGAKKHKGAHAVARG
jgi:hypothetical protein